MSPAESLYPTFAHRFLAAWIEATFWDRAPELTDQDLSARGIDSPAALDAAQAIDLLDTSKPSAWAAFATLEEDAKVWWPGQPDENLATWRQRIPLGTDVADGIDDFPGPAHDSWVILSLEDQEDLRDFATWRTLKVKGPRGLLHPAQLGHLTQMWEKACDPARPLPERTRATRRWTRIFDALPDLRGQWCDTADPVTVATEVDRALEDIKQLSTKPWASAGELVRKLRERFPAWPQPDLDELAAAIWRRSSYIDIVHLCVARLINRKPGGVRDLVTQGRKVLELERLAAEGRRRWEMWRRERGR